MFVMRAILFIPHLAFQVSAGWSSMSVSFFVSCSVSASNDKWNCSESTIFSWSLLLGTSRDIMLDWWIALFLYSREGSDNFLLNKPNIGEKHNFVSAMLSDLDVMLLKDLGSESSWLSREVRLSNEQAGERGKLNKGGSYLGFRGRWLGALGGVESRKVVGYADGEERLLWWACFLPLPGILSLVIPGLSSVILIPM